MKRAARLATAGIGVSLCLAATAAMTSIPARAESDLTMNTVLTGAGTACLVSGSVVGIAVAAGGPTLATPVGAVAAVAPGPTAAAVAASGLMGCGIGASAAVVYYGAIWAYETFLMGPKYPLLYPAPAAHVGELSSSSDEPARDATPD